MLFIPASLRTRLPSRKEAVSRAVTLYNGVRTSPAVADARSLARSARRRWDRSRLRLDPALARELLKVIEEETVPGLPPIRTTVFEQQACKFCRSLHPGHCPAVRELEYHPDGRVARVSFWPKWDASGVLRREDIETAASWKDDDDAA